MSPCQRKRPGGKLLHLSALLTGGAESTPQGHSDKILLPEGLQQPHRPRGAGPPLQRSGPTKGDKGLYHRGPHPQSALTTAQAGGSETDSAPPPEQQESPDSPREDSQKTLTQKRELLEQKRREFTKEKECLNKENERLDQENDKLDRWIEKRERMNKWLNEVSEALKQGTPVPDQPEDPEIIYPGYREDNETSEDAPGAAENAPASSTVEAPAQGSQENFTSGPNPQEEEAPVNQVEGPQENQDRVPLDQAVSELCGDQVAERPPVPIEANVIVVNKDPAAPESPTPDQDIINVEDNGQGYDSDCQIVEGHPRPSTSEQTTLEPSGLWRLKKQLGRPLQIKLIRNEKEWGFQIQYQLHPHPPQPQECQRAGTHRRSSQSRILRTPQALRTPHRTRIPRILKMTRTPRTPLKKMTGNRVQSPLSVNKNLPGEIADKNTVYKLLCLLWIAVLWRRIDNKIIQVQFKYLFTKS